MKRQPFFVLLVTLILGIVFQEYFVLNFRTVIILLIFSFLGLFSGFIKNFYLIKYKNLFTVIFVFCLGISLLNFAKKEAPHIPLDKKENLTFSLDKKLNSTEKNRRYEVQVYKDKSIFKSILTIPRDKTELDFSHYYQAEVFIKKTKPPYADFVFNYQKYLARKAIFFEAYLPGRLYQSQSKPLSLSETIKNERLKILNRISHSSLDIKSASFLKGIILADRTEMDAKTISDFQNSGLIHLLAISGTHIGIIYGLLYFLLIKVFPAKLRNYAIILSLLFIWAFAIFIGLGNSVARSCIMITTYMVYILLQRKPDLLHALSLAGLLILIVNPQQIFDVGFQLSFSAVLGIYWLNKPILNLVPRSKYKAGNFLISILVITITAQISTLPLVLFYFHQFSFISIIANMIVIPLAEIVIAISLFLAIILSLNFDAFWLNELYDVMILHLLKLIHWFGNLDFAMHRNVSLNIIEVFVLFTALYFLKFLVDKISWKNILQIGFVFLLFISLRLTFNYQKLMKNEILSHIYFDKKLISIKNGTEIYFIIPQNIDRKKAEKYIIEPYIISRRNKDFKIKNFNENIKTIVINKQKYPVN